MLCATLLYRQHARCVEKGQARVIVGSDGNGTGNVRQTWHMRLLDRRRMYERTLVPVYVLMDPTSEVLELNMNARDAVRRIKAHQMRQPRLVRGKVLQA